MLLFYSACDLFVYRTRCIFVLVPKKQSWCLRPLFVHRLPARTDTRLHFWKRETGKAVNSICLFFLPLVSVSGLHAALFSRLLFSLFPQIEFAQRTVAFVNGSVADAFYLFSSGALDGSIQFSIAERESERFLLFSSFGTKMLLNGVISFQVSLVKCLMLLAIASVHLVLSTVEWNACEQADLQFCSWANESCFEMQAFVMDYSLEHSYVLCWLKRFQITCLMINW